MYQNIKENDSQHCPEQTSQWSVSFLTSNTRYMNPLKVLESICDHNNSQLQTDFLPVKQALDYERLFRKSY